MLKEGNRGSVVDDNVSGVKGILLVAEGLEPRIVICYGDD